MAWWQDRIVYVLKHTGESFSSKEKALKALQRAPARRLLRSPRTGSPQIGDVRVSFSEVACRTVSVMAKQSGFTLTPWHSSQGEVCVAHSCQCTECRRHITCRGTLSRWWSWEGAARKTW